MKRFYNVLTLFGCGLCLLAAQVGRAQTGTVLGFGNNGEGQLGDNTTTNHPLITPAFHISGIKAVACGYYHTLALDSTGTVWAWGENYYGQLGDGTTTFRTTPVAVLEGIKAIAAGGWHSLALDATGRIWAWGYNGYGELGVGDKTDRHTPVEMIGSYSSRAKAIWTGAYHSLVLNDQGWLTGCGGNFLGQLAQGDVADRTSLTYICSNAVAMAAGGYHTLVQFGSSSVYATGYNADGQLGDGTTIQRLNFTPVKNATFNNGVAIGAIAAGGLHSEILKPYTNVLGTGLNNHGQLGVGNLTQRNAPVWMSRAGNSILAVAAGNSYGMHSLMLRADGTVWACGMNSSGQLGNGTTTDSSLPVQVKGPNGVGVLTNIIAIAAGDNFSLALGANGLVYSWGNDAHGQLGIGSFTNVPFPVVVPFMSNVFAIAAGAQHSLLLSDDGRIYGCGWNAYGQLGMLDTQDRLYFEHPEGTFNYIALAAGGAHSLGLQPSGQIYGWGSNYIGQLALGDATDRYYPTLQPGTVATAIACGGNHSLHLNGAGEVFASGGNPFGELGLGDTFNRYNWAYNGYAPETIGLASGLDHSLFLNLFGYVTASGQGTFGALGTGNTANQSLPSYATGAEFSTSIAGGGYHSLFLTNPLIQAASITLSPTSVTGGTSATGKVILNGPAGPGGQRVYLWVSTDGNYVDCATVPAYVDVPAASTAVIFPITTKHVTSKVVVSINAWLNKGVGANFTILP